MADPNYFWDRIEPHTRSEQLEEGLQARVADPLWFLARQWQVGEFRGEDASTPIHASLEVGWQPLKTFRNEAHARQEIEPIRAGRPLEVRVEAAPVGQNTGDIALAVESGLQFLRRLAATPLAHLRAKFREAFALDIDPARLEGLPERERNRLTLMARRALDGRKLFSAPDEHILDVASSMDERTLLEAILSRWRISYNDRFEEPVEYGDTWVSERLEHAFSVGVATHQGELLLSAPEYAGGHLDWHSFDIVSDPAVKHGLGYESIQRRSAHLLPVPLAYAGMPNSRWWEFEEGTIYFGDIEGGPADIGRMCIAEFATVYSDDWFLLPIRLPVGSLARVTRLRVLDTFGRSHRILPTAFNDLQRVGLNATNAERPWVFFELAGDPSIQNASKKKIPSAEDEDQLAPWLYLPPVLMGSMHGKALEEVGFLRDEGANLGWAIESTIEAPTGRPLKRRHLWGLAQTSSSLFEKGPGKNTNNPDEAWKYKLQTLVPPYWIPLIPERVNEQSSEMRLRRARMLAWDDIPEKWAKGPKGDLLAPHRPLWFYEEEIPPGGIQVSRRWQMARGGDGTLHLWMSRRKRPGRGERGSGLKYDTMEK